MGVQPARRRAAHADAVVGGAAADALGHVHAVAAPAAGCAVVLRAAEVAPLPGHLRQRSLLHTPAEGQADERQQLRAITALANAQMLRAVLMT